MFLRRRLQRQQQPPPPPPDDAPASSSPTLTYANSNNTTNGTSHRTTRRSLDIELAKKEVIIKLQADSLVEANDQIRRLLDQLADKACQAHELQQRLLEQQRQQQQQQQTQDEGETTSQEEQQKKPLDNNSATSSRGSGTSDNTQTISTMQNKIQSLEATIEQLQRQNAEHVEERRKLENIITELTIFIEEQQSTATTSTTGTAATMPFHSFTPLQSLSEESGEDDDEHQQQEQESDVEETTPTTDLDMAMVAPAASFPPSTSTTTSTTTTSVRHALPPGHKLLLLISSMPGAHPNMAQHQRRLHTILQGLLLDTHEAAIQILDGCDPALKQLRDDLFRISGLQAKYPQLFLVQSDDLQFVGDYDAVVELHDAELLVDALGLRVLQE